MADITKIEPLARVELSRNGTPLYKQFYAPASETFDEYVSDRLSLATNMTVAEAYSLGGVSSAEWLLVEVDQEVQLGVNSSSNLIPVGGVFMLGGSSVTSLYFQNLNTNTQATVQVVATD